MNYKMIYSDLDGTLLNSKKEISNDNKEIITKLGDVGIIFGIATGRIYPAAKIYAKELNLNSPIICCNGALVVDPRNDHAVISNAINNSKVKEIVNIIKKYDVYFHFYTIDTIYAERSEYIIEYFKELSKGKAEDEKVKTVINSSVTDLITEDMQIFKVGVFVDDSKKSNEMIEELQQIEDISAYKSLGHIFDIVAEGVDKGRALEQLGELLNVKREEIMVFGDNENDINMIKYAGMGIAMENSKDDVKAVSNYIAKTNDEDGVFYGVKNFIEL
ncbi:MAG: Cof-type HAD-IIB family hydrolase [Acidaminobacteraceae bacterium]